MPEDTEPILSESTRELVKKVSLKERHPGLQLDKLSAAGNQKHQKSMLEQVAWALRDEDMLRTLRDRHDTMLNSLDALRLQMTTCGALTLHLSRSGALENAGIALHPIYGFVYLPGSAIKGLTRAYAETVWAPAQSDKEKAWRQIERVFGWSPGSERHKQVWRPSEITTPAGASAGRLVFHDAWPCCWPQLILDVVNNHHSKYYDGKEGDGPGDWEEPTLVYFLAIGADEKFEFAISDRTNSDSELLKLTYGWLKEALIFEGAGAKTAAGYGRFKPVEGGQASMLEPIPEKMTGATYELQLASPAFLAGAKQEKEDCDLRPATLRGLLRWWWRTMHAAHLDPKTLKRLETAIWGDAESGSPVRIAVSRAKGGGPKQYYRDDPQFRYFLRRPKEQQVTQGLFYASYGMADDPGKNRWYRPAGASWSVRLDARRGYLLPSEKHGKRQEIAPSAILDQANAALWLLCRFGGVGSRSRKGFGSFNDIDVADIGSKEDCIASAKQLRALCKLEGTQRQSQTPALEEALPLLEQDTVWTDPWYALDQTGMALQLFAKKTLNAEERLSLGLPRRVGRGRDAQKLTSRRKGDRHASPALWSITTRQDKKLTVRLMAFPAAYLPDKETSTRRLKQFTKSEGCQKLKKQAVQPQRRSGHGGDGVASTGHAPRRGDRRQEPTIARPPQAGLKTNDRVQAELLEEKTKKGRWKAKHRDSGLQGPIQDTENVPTDAEPGQCVELTVVSVNRKELAFKWETPPPPTSPKKESRRGGGKSGSKSRRG